MGCKRLMNSGDRAVPTTLSSLDERRVTDLLYHGYVLALTQSVLNLGWPPPDDAVLDFGRFLALVEDV